jgi:hypothetical protein
MPADPRDRRCACLARTMARTPGFTESERVGQASITAPRSGSNSVVTAQWGCTPRIGYGRCPPSLCAPPSANASGSAPGAGESVGFAPPSVLLAEGAAGLRALALPGRRPGGLLPLRHLPVIGVYKSPRFASNTRCIGEAARCQGRLHFATPARRNAGDGAGGSSWRCHSCLRSPPAAFLSRQTIRNVPVCRRRRRPCSKHDHSSAERSS